MILECPDPRLAAGATEIRAAAGAPLGTARVASSPDGAVCVRGDPSRAGLAAAALVVTGGGALVIVPYAIGDVLYERALPLLLAGLALLVVGALLGLTARKALEVRATATELVVVTPRVLTTSTSALSKDAITRLDVVVVFERWKNVMRLAHAEVRAALKDGETIALGRTADGPVDEWRGVRDEALAVARALAFRLAVPLALSREGAPPPDLVDDDD